MENFIIVTGLFDIKKRDPSFTRRSIERYLSLFKYIDDLNLPTILFTESHLIDKIKKRDNLFIVELNIEDLPIYKKISAIGDNRLSSPLNININHLYTAVINSKVELISKANDYLINNGVYTNISHLI